MLTPSQITALRDMSGQVMDPIVDFLIEDIAKRVAEAGQLTSTAAYQTWKLQKLGVSQKQLKKEIQKRLKISQKQVEQLMTQAAKTGYNFDISRFPTADAIPFAENTTVQQILDGTVKLAGDDLTNVTQTMGFVAPDGRCEELSKAYEKTCDFAFQKVANGAQDYTSVIREATRNLAEKGIRTIDYDSDTHASLEAAVRRNLMSGLGMMNEQVTQQNHDDLGCDGWEISAHGGSAPDHEPIQGKQYSDKEFQRLNNSLVRRIGTLNCGHSAMPIIMGVNEPQYTAAELEEFRRQNAEGIDFEGRHYSLYEAAQRQRSLERGIRKTKRRILIDEATGDTEKLQWDQIRLVRTREEYHRFSKAAGLPEQHERMEKAGFTWKHGKAAEKVVVLNGKVEHSKTENALQVFKLNSQYKMPDGSFNIRDATKDYAEFLTSVPEKNRILLEQSFAGVEYEQRKLKSAPFGYLAKDNEDKILYDPTRRDFWGIDFTVANTHELAHRIDNFFIQSDNNPAFREAIQNAQKAFRGEPEKFQSYCEKNDKHGFLSDICSAISEGTWDFPAGHPAEYWARTGTKEKEIFANLFSLEAFDDKDKLVFLRDNFPGILKVYQNMEYEVI